MKIFLPAVCCVAALGIAAGCSEAHASDESLYGQFVNPPAEARPFVRWWWNGGCVEQGELAREIDLLSDAGFGGIEINTIEMPEWSGHSGEGCTQWNSEEWTRAVRFAADKARKKGMISDLIIGSGWPFGGRFLKTEQTNQRVEVKNFPIRASSQNTFSVKQLSDWVVTRHEPLKKEVFLLRFVPDDIRSTDQVIDLMGKFDPQKGLSFTAPAQDGMLVAGVRIWGYEHVTNGAPGADGPVMDHYKADNIRSYIGRLKDSEEKYGFKFKDYIRAFFCDSIELSGANWTDDFAREFKKQTGYDLDPYLPFVFYPFKEGYPEESYDEKFAAELKKVRFDFNQMLIHMLLERFTIPLHEQCQQMGVKSRYQAYGFPWFMGISEGNLVPDIPESNNWININKGVAEPEAFTWPQSHGYMLWNKFAQAAGNIMGRKIVSNEAMTKTQFVFTANMGIIKEADDMNFITGTNHSILHGFNYSPLSAGMPGWVRYGTYFSEHNPWWPYLDQWVTYNARISSVMQNSTQNTRIAILPPFSGHYGNSGLFREPLQLEPWYFSRLWEPVSNLGEAVDYLSEALIDQAKIEDGKLRIGRMSYDVLLLPDVDVMQGAVAEKIAEFIRRGGKAVFIGSVPDKAASLTEGKDADARVRKIFADLKVRPVPAPKAPEDLLPWTKALFEKIGFTPEVEFTNPSPYIYQIYKTASDGKKVLFVTNSHHRDQIPVEVKTSEKDLIPYRWDPQSGRRYRMDYDPEKGRIAFSLLPNESALIVMEEESLDLPLYREHRLADYTPVEVASHWTVGLNRMDGQEKQVELDTLSNLLTRKGDPFFKDFSGEVTYTTWFDVKKPEKCRMLDLGDVFGQVAVLYVNGKQVGTSWWGRPLFDVSEAFNKGNNRIEVKCVTNPSNYFKSLKDNETAQHWSVRNPAQPYGIAGPVTLLVE